MGAKPVPEQLQQHDTTAAVQLPSRSGHFSFPMYETQRLSNVVVVCEVSVIISGNSSVL